MESPACKHHWIIESPNGTESPGVCRVCGETRTFLNWSEESFGHAAQMIGLARQRAKAAAAAKEKANAH